MFIFTLLSKLREAQFAFHGQTAGLRSRLGKPSLIGPVCALLLFFCPPLCLAQYTTGLVAGSVLDPSAAPIKDAIVDLRSMETGAERQFPTNSDGSFSFTAVPPGRYRLQVNATGFTSPSTEIVVNISQTTTQNFTLQIGQATTNIEVKANADTLLDASDPLRGVIYNETEVGTLPNLGRNINNLVILVPGATPTFNPRGGEFTTVNGAQAGQINANGGRSKSTSAQLDYTDANDWEFGGIALGTEPTPEMLSEFQVLTNNWAAEYGVKSTAQIVMVTKSGSNALHGTAYDFIQNAALNARNYFDTTGKPAPLVQNYYGFTVGGPILRNRTFFFAGYEGRSTHGAGSTLVADLPTTAARAMATDPSVLSLLKLLPQPTTATSNPLIGTSSISEPNPSTNQQYLLRADHYFSSKNSLTLRYYSSSGTSVDRIANSLPQDDASFDPVGRNAMIAETWTPRPNMTNELRIAYGRSSALFEPLTTPATQRYNVTGLVGFGTEQYWPQGRVFNVYQLSDGYSIVRNKHTVKAGLDLRYIQDNSLNYTNSRGIFTFTSINNFLAGTIGSYTQLFGNTYRGFRESYDGFFVQDDWKLRPTLTLNLGLRYEYQGSQSDANHQQSVLNTSGTGNIGQLGSGPLGVFNTRNPLINSRPALFAPRFGFAWDPMNGRIVVRGGYGVYFDSLIFNGLQAGRTAPPTDYTVTLTNFTGGNTLANLLAGTSPFQTTYTAQVGSFNNVTNLGSVVSENPNIRNPYNQQYSLGVEYHLTPSIVAEVSYTGSRGEKLTTYEPINSTVPSSRPSPATSAADQAARLAEFKAYYASENGQNNPRIDPRFNDVSYINSTGSSNYDSLQVTVSQNVSHGLLFRASYVLSHSLDNSSDYSPGQGALDFNFEQNQFNSKAEYGNSDFDIRQRFVLSNVWQIPVFRDQRGIAGHVLGGWTFATVDQVQSGLPFTVMNGSIAGIPDANMDGNTVSGLDNSRPNCVSGGTFTMGKPASNTKYVPTLLGNNGNCARNTARLNKFINFDWTFSKNIRMFEKGFLGSGPWNLEYRADLFNAFNNPYLSVSGTNFLTLSSPSFGVYNTAAASRRIQMALKINW